MIKKIKINLKIILTVKLIAIIIYFIITLNLEEKNENLIRLTTLEFQTNPSSYIGQKIYISGGWFANFKNPGDMYESISLTLQGRNRVIENTYGKKYYPNHYSDNHYFRLIRINESKIILKIPFDISEKNPDIKHGIVNITGILINETIIEVHKIDVIKTKL